MLENAIREVLSQSKEKTGDSKDSQADTDLKTTKHKCPTATLPPPPPYGTVSEVWTIGDFFIGFFVRWTFFPLDFFPLDFFFVVFFPFDFFSVGLFFSALAQKMVKTIIDFSEMFTFVDVKNGGVQTLDFFAVGLFFWPRNLKIRKLFFPKNQGRIFFRKLEKIPPPPGLIKFPTRT